MSNAGLLVLAVAALFSVPSKSLANRANISPQELARAINEAPADSAPFRGGKVSAADIQRVRCEGPDEEPTEVECTWRQRTDHGWVGHREWLFIDRNGWHVSG